MNRQRKKDVTRATEMVKQAHELMIQAAAIAEGVLDDEQEIFDNLSEGAQNNDSGEERQSGINALQDFIESIKGIDTEQMLNDLSQQADLSSETGIEASMTEDQIMERREARLPQWAKQKIDQVIKQRDDAVSQASSLFDDPVPGDPCFTIADSGALADKRIPSRRIDVSELGISIYISKGMVGDKVAEMLTVMGNRSLILMPRSSNQFCVAAA